MKKLLLILPVLGFLAACGEPTTEERARLDGILPDGCKVYEVGSYGELKDLVFVKCDGREVVSTNGAWTAHSGKTTVTRQFASVVIG